MGPRLTYQDGSTPNVCIIGAGLSGLCAAIQLKRKLGLNTFTIFERAVDVGGVWLANTYPGCATDVPALTYSFSFEPNPGWTRLCPERQEFWAYLQTTAKKYNIYPHVQFQTEVKSAKWNESSKNWTVVAANLKTGEERTKTFQIVILGTGNIREPNYPRVFNYFTGPMMHSAEWNAGVRLENQVVGVVGNGASALQLVPAIASRTKQLVVFMRQPNHMIPKQDFSFPWIFKLLFRLFPFLLWILRCLGFLIFDFFYANILHEDGLVNKTVSLYTRIHLWRHTKCSKLRDALTPHFPFGYKIPGYGDRSFYKTLAKPNVEVVRSSIVRVNGEKIVTADGAQHRLDVLILCTGFKPQDFFSPIQIIGAGNVNLIERWKADRPETFYGVACVEAPNMFFLPGPNSIGGSIPFVIECQVNLVIHALRQLMSRQAASIQVKLKAQDASMDEIEDAMRNTVYYTVHKRQPQLGTKTWLSNGRGWPTVPWPTSTITYWRRTRSLDPSSFIFEGKSSLTNKTGQDEEENNNLKTQQLAIV